MYPAPGDYAITAEITTADEVTTVSQLITIYPLPQINRSVTLKQCDDNTDGISVFNLTEAEGIIADNTSGLSFSYHLTSADANSNTNEITTTISNTTASQVFARVETQLGCYDVAEINLQVVTTSIPDDFNIEIVECDNELIDNDANNGITTFNFSEATSTILGLFPSNQSLSVSYYETVDDALVEQNEVDPTNFRNENSPFLQQIIVRVDSQTDNSCIGLGQHITLKVGELPDFEIEEEQYICSSDLPTPSRVLSVLNPIDDYIYEWRGPNNELLNTQGSIVTIEVFEAGQYSVTAISRDNCTTTKTVNVIESNLATIVDIDVIDDSSNNMITVVVSGLGDYEFALDDENGFYQESNVFNSVLAGIRTVYIRDRNGCGTVSQEVSVIGYPNFFTPNGDNFNDTWQVSGITLQPESEIVIFDRFGKVIKQLHPMESGWDGTYRGEPMPQSDYWFVAKLQDGRTRRGHFSLIRK